MTPFVGLGVSAPKPTESLKQTAIDISAEDLIHRLTPQNVADLVLLSMVSDTRWYGWSDESFVIFVIKFLVYGSHSGWNVH